ncbi:MAG: CpaF family protein [Nocardioidaceae bacterium]|nr:CpaF family protein [Nocardioidaceae bacterium]
MPPAIEALDADVRDEVRRSGIDPLTQVETVRRFAQSVVRAHDDRSLSGAVRPLDDPERMVAELVARVAGFGPLQAYLDDPAVEEVWINQPDRVFVARDGSHELTTTILTAAEVRDLVERMLKTSGRRLDLSSPFVDAMLPSGHRLHVVLDGITRGFSAVNIRKFVVRANRLSELVELGTLTRQAAAFLDACVVAGLNIVVAGGTQAGKTTLLNTLGSAVPGRERIVSAEEVYELRFDHPDWVAMQTRQSGLEGTGEIKLRHLVKEALRMRPSRIVVGEVRAEECLDLLLALNSGLPGMATVHANSAREALVKLCTLPLLAGENIQKGVYLDYADGHGRTRHHLRPCLSRPQGRWHERHEAARTWPRLREAGESAGHRRDTRRQQVGLPRVPRARRVRGGPRPDRARTSGSAHSLGGLPVVP